ncbi:MAG: UvrD-helicase domain-containing protein, partial [Gemmataceae bacterium]
MRPTENYRRFSPNQRHALDRARNLAVRANAGSGKTRVLVERIVQQLAASFDAGTPLKLTSFVAITFTRKAAGEIQDRLRASFQTLSGAAGAEERAYWQDRIDELPRAAIGTIDSFCARLLREFALEGEGPARIEPDFEPLDDYEAALLRREAIDRVLNRLSEAADEPLTPEQEACRWWG